MPATRCGSAYADGLAPFQPNGVLPDKSLPAGARWESVWSSEQPLQFDVAVVLHPCEVYGDRHCEIIEEIHHLTGDTVPLDVEVVAADAQINRGFLHGLLIGSTTISLKVSGIHV